MILVNLEPMCIIRRCGFQNGGLKSNMYESPLLVNHWFINVPVYALYNPANSDVLKKCTLGPLGDIFSNFKAQRWSAYKSYTAQRPWAFYITFVGGCYDTLNVARILDNVILSNIEMC